MIDDFVRLVVKNLEEARQSRVNSLIAGAADPGAYKYGCGEIHGLDIAIAEILAVQEKAEHHNDPDD